MENTRHIIGCMTGTSLDGLDVALARIDGRGLGLTATLLAHHAAPLPAALRDTLGQLAGGQALPPVQILRAARHLGVVHAQACAQLMDPHPDVVLDASSPTAKRSATPQATGCRGSCSTPGRWCVP